MRILTTLFSLLLVLTVMTVPVKETWAGSTLDPMDTDTAARDAVIGFFDLRERETYIQLTNISEDLPGETFHIQIYNVGNLCNENNFFDNYTPNDTHVYNMRDITKNDGTPSSVVLPDDAYGIFIAYLVDDDPVIIGNMRILDNSGYEYRTNLAGYEDSIDVSGPQPHVATFNFNTLGDVTLSDIVGFVSGEVVNNNELNISSILNTWTNWDIDIIDTDENVSSCRSVVFACINQDHPLLEDLLETVVDDVGSGAANVASFEYGINDRIPSSKDAPLLCPGNIVSDGFVRLQLTDDGDDTVDQTTLFVGLNNGNGRGSMDVFITQSIVDIIPEEEDDVETPETQGTPAP